VAIPRPHTATPVLWVQSGERIEGERDVSMELGTPFGCFLQLPGGEEDSGTPRGRRQVKRPTLLFNARDLIGEVIELSNADELLVEAPLLTGPDPVRWQIVGTPEYLASPRRLVGFQARLKRVED
jgi:hypothetical protein